MLSLHTANSRSRHSGRSEPGVAHGAVHNDRVTGRTAHPFEPKSIARLQAGQFWAVPLSDGRHACGRVLHVPGTADSLYLNSRVFLAGLMDWSGSEPPTSEAIAGCGVLAHVYAGDVHPRRGFMNNSGHAYSCHLNRSGRFPRIAASAHFDGRQRRAAEALES